MARNKLICGNWKMNQTVAEIKTFFDEMKVQRNKITCAAWVAPQLIHIPLVREMTSALKMEVGAQNSSHKTSGAFTGDVSPLAIKESGASFVLVGHSERRAFFKETDAILNEKMLLALKSGLKVIFCVGETLSEREGKKTEAVVRTQLDEGLKNFPLESQAQLLIAYEPVWAIGTGKNATAGQAQEMHDFIRRHLKSVHKFASESLTILYGGSLKPDNVADLLGMPDIDGGLVGGASLKASDYLQLCLAASK